MIRSLSKEAVASSSEATSRNLQFIRYGLAGLVNTIAGFIAYSSMVVFFNAPFWVANIVALCAGLIVGFVLARLFVFKQTRTSVQKSAWKYVTTICGQFALSTAVIGLLVGRGFGPIIAYVIALPAIILLSFALQRNWVFNASSFDQVGP